MKRLLFIAIFMSMAIPCMAQDCDRHSRHLKLNIVPPREAAASVGKYVRKVGKHSVEGGKVIIKGINSGVIGFKMIGEAPFVQENWWQPKKKTIKWFPGFWTPGKFKVEDEEEELDLKIEIEDGYEYPLHFDAKPDSKKIVV